MILTQATYTGRRGNRLLATFSYSANPFPELEQPYSAALDCQNRQGLLSFSPAPPAFCTAVNLLDLKDIKDVLAQTADEIHPDMSLKEKSAAVAGLFQSAAEKRSISLKLNKKKPKK